MRNYYLYRGPYREYICNKKKNVLWSKLMPDGRKTLIVVEPFPTLRVKKPEFKWVKYTDDPQTLPRDAKLIEKFKRDKLINVFFLEAL